MHYLVATDGSGESDAALERVLAVADPADAVTLLHVVQPDVYETGGTEPVSGLADAERRLVVEDVEDAETEGEAILERAAERVPDGGPSVETVLRYGDPATQVVAFASESGVDEIVVGHRGRSPRFESMLGSVANDVVREADVPVTVVR